MGNFTSDDNFPRDIAKCPSYHRMTDPPSPIVAPPEDEEHEHDFENTSDPNERCPRCKICHIYEDQLSFTENLERNQKLFERDEQRERMQQESRSSKKKKLDELVEKKKPAKKRKKKKITSVKDFIVTEAELDSGEEEVDLVKK